MKATIQDVREADARYQAGAGIYNCKKAVDPANEIFDGDALKGLLYVLADGYAISVGSKLPPEERRAARLKWNMSMAESQAAMLRERFG